MITFEDISAAAKRIEGKVIRTPTIPSHALSRATGAEVTLKLENLQAVGSFKERGAANKLALLSAEERERGVIAVSAGNHAQGVARHASLLGIDAVIVMPRFTPAGKVVRTRNWGARVVLEGESFAEAVLFAKELQEREGRTFVHPYDDPAVMAGQGTCALELLEDAGPLDMLIAPIGGGGLLAGCSVATRAMRPDVELIGVQVESYNSLSAFPGPATHPVGGATIAEGIAVLQIGQQTDEVIRDMVSQVLIVPEAAVENAITLLAEGAKQISEGAGAVSLAAMLTYPDIFRGKKVAMPVSGGNIDSRILANTLLRAMLRDGRILRLIMEIPDRPGVLADISGKIGKAGGNIIEVSHRRLLSAPSVQAAELEVMIEARDPEHAISITAELRQFYTVKYA
ncbi:MULTISPECIES: threonine ammonia-lyase [Acetobacter]|uniref:L-threonine dehydratase catabolic TdcB n=1 Tax=Acetobacter thailandicus TaxID=1502842 RepID=A0ABT3QFE4_9PROT|nr:MULTISPECIES: threonine ammonia-lyase [Acetobacter]MBS0960111.1 threonine ammonia-lyase [Acetobacter thailandicus]MBS1002559.1 threonine ammonia-lyase [Acetobacter thailandicus]MCX2563975.1 threonine ammonia-lyase [Acetobacter thailandicus]NHN94955.1 threonine ammonia-lyase [Acetobacter thailandicus]OUI88519.1 threonine dehydratase [Acetobacter sp. DmW_043]